MVGNASRKLVWPLVPHRRTPGTFECHACEQLRAFPVSEVHFSCLGGLRCPIDEAFGDLSQSGISLLFFSQGLLQKPGRIA